MKHLFKRMMACLLCMVMLVIPMQLSPAAATAATDSRVLAYVPLDDRPVVVDRVIYGAESAGFDIQLPPDASLYQTHLDDQLVNKDNPDTKYTDESQVGNGAAIMDWLEEMEADGCDYYIIHLDMMFSGGLVGSRYPDTHYDENGYLNISEQLEIAERLAALSNDTENKVYFVDTVVRLASTSNFKGYKGDMYDALRAYSKKARWPLDPQWWYGLDYAGSCDIINAIKDNYQRGDDWQTITFGSPLTQEKVDLYHLARHRKLRLINYMMEYARNAYYIVGVDDASPQNTIQSNDIKFIEARMEDLGIGYSLFADTDSAGLMALSRLVTDYYGDTQIPVKVRYYGDMADQPADDYDIGTLRTNVQSHVECANGVVTSGTGKVELLVLTKISTSHTISGNGYSSAYVSNINALIAQAKANIANNVPTIIVDCSTEANYRSSWVKGRSDARFINLQDELLKNVEISKLLGYSNWNTVGNTLGIAIGQGMARYGYLANETSVSAASHTAFVKAMTYTFIKDITYNARNKMSDYTWQFQYWITKEINAYNSANGTSYTNMNFYEYMFGYDGNKDSGNCLDYELCDGEHRINNELEYCMMQGGNASAYTGCGQQVLNAIKAGEFYTKLGNRVETAAITELRVDNFRFPWYRQFEISFDIFPTLKLGYFNINGDFFEKVNVKQTVADVAEKAKEQYGASSVVLYDLSNNVASGIYAGTGFTVEMTIGGVKSSYTVVIPTEINGDGKTTTADVREVMLNVVGVNDLTAAQTEAADMDTNGTIGSTDARRILQSILDA